MATWALVVSLLSFLIALVALGWQVFKHFLDGGRVKVYLNTAILEPEFMLAVNRSGRFALRDDSVARSVKYGKALEVAQLVVENPGRVPVTVYSPGLSISGHGKKDHSLVPRMFATGASFGPDEAIKDTVVRVEPYGRVTFLLDHWSVLPGLLSAAPRRRVVVRGFVGVAGRTNRPQKSSWSRRWRLRKGVYTAIKGSPEFTPLSVIWREMYGRIPEREDETNRHSNAGSRITRGMLRYMLDEAMSRFDERPDRAQLTEALNEIAKREGDGHPALNSAVFQAYEALDRMTGHLTAWSEGLFHFERERKEVNKNGATGVAD
ncbi:hypothetical protein [Planctomonas deserti]|uniref:hypothetical protein n=1 Tax=Planctomonas deserti TaxID=2144185 RepID=UPI000D3BFE52|nr:hypothetical protein [Planctomonas deserti]